VLLDVRMPGMDGLETALHLAALDRPPAVVFTTAYEDHALAAFDAGAIDYLLKPIRLERLGNALQKAALLSRARIEQLRGSATTPRPRTHIGSTTHGRLTLIPISEIACLSAGQRYVSIGWAGREYLTEESLVRLEQEFGTRFLRIHRNALIAPAFVEQLERQADGSLLVRLRGVADGLAVSRRHAAEVRRVLRGLG
jgi:two-component system response regulator AlgR